MPTVRVDDGAELYYEEFGDGPEVVVSASMALSPADAYPALLAQAPTHYHVYQVQLRGFGNSSHVYEDLGTRWYDVWAEDIYQVARRLGLNRFIYTGVSHGSGVGWHLALAHPEALKAFISIVGAPHDRERPRTIGMGVGGPGAARWVFYEVPTTDPVRLARRERRAALLRQRVLTPEEQAINPGKALPTITTNAELAATLARVRVPTLMLGGMQDDIIQPEAMLLAARAVEGSKLILFQDHAHSLASEAPERVIAEVKLFVDDLNARAPREAT